MAQRSATWTEDDDVEAKQSLDQKEALTAQMIDIISARLNSLQTTANNRKHGLECDLRVNLEYCSKMVPPLTDMLESRSAAIAKGQTISSVTLASNQAMLERLFGRDDKARAHVQVLKKMKMEGHKSDNRRNARGQLEKQLQVSVEGHITRTVESYVFGMDDMNVHNSVVRNSIRMDTQLLLLHTFDRIHISHGQRNFKKFMLSELSGALFEEVFWLVFCHFYQKDSLAQQRALVDEISSKYVKMIVALRGSMDYLFRIYPYAVASGVCWGFHYLFPGSRHLYTPEFKNNVYLFVCQLLLGLKMTPASVQYMRQQYFPEEFVDDIGTKIKPMSELAVSTSMVGGAMTGSNLTRHRNLDSIARLPRLLPSQVSQSLIASASEPSYLGKIAIGDNSIAKILEPQTTFVSNRGLDSEEEVVAVRCFRRHQQRAFFNAAQLSPLMKQHFRSQTANAKKVSLILRTTPAADCIVGGEETFHKFYLRKPPSHALEAQGLHKKCMRDIQNAQQDTKRDIAALHEARDLILTSGKKAMQTYCSILMGHKHASDADDVAATGMVLGTTNQSDNVRGPSL